jgi:hypothetical protein
MFRRPITMSYSKTEQNNIFTIKTIQHTYLVKNFSSIYNWAAELSDFKKCYPQISTYIYHILIAATKYFSPYDLLPDNKKEIAIQNFQKKTGVTLKTVDLTDDEKALIKNYKILIIYKLIEIFTKYNKASEKLLNELNEIVGVKTRIFTSNYKFTITQLRESLEKINSVTQKVINILTVCQEKNAFSYVYIDNLISTKNIKDIINKSNSTTIIPPIDKNTIDDYITNIFVNFFGYKENYITNMTTELNNYPDLRIQEDIEYRNKLINNFQESKTIEVSTGYSPGSSISAAQQISNSGFGGKPKSKKNNYKISRKNKKTKTKRQRKTRRRR